MGRTTENPSYYYCKELLFFGQVRSRGGSHEKPPSVQRLLDASSLFIRYNICYYYYRYLYIIYYYGTLLLLLSSSSLLLLYSIILCLNGAAAATTVVRHIRRRHNMRILLYNILIYNMYMKNSESPRKIASFGCHHKSSGIRNARTGCDIYICSRRHYTVVLNSSD